MNYPEGFKEFILKNYKGVGNKELTSLINHEFNSNFSVGQIKYYKKRNKLNSGLTGRFEKGNIPPNKGKKGYCHPGCVATQFKKGSKPPNTHPIGTEIVRDDGYIWIKVNENPGPHNIAKRWIPKARYVYQQAHGPISDDVTIIHLDGNPFNDTLENLMAVSRKELLVLNSKKLIFNNPSLTSEGVLIAKTIVKIEERIKDAKE